MKASGKFRFASVSCRIPPNKTLTALGTVMGLMALSFGGVSYAQNNLVTPAQYLQMQPKPNFAPGYTLPPLTLWGQGLSFDAYEELATNWGYALMISGPTGGGELVKNAYGFGTTLGIQAALADTNSVAYQEMILCSNYPNKFQLGLLIDRDIGTNITAGLWVTNSSGYYVDESSNTLLANRAGLLNNFSNANWSYNAGPFKSVFSPEADVADLDSASAYEVSAFAVIVSNFPGTPIAIVLNGGERWMTGSGVPPNSSGVWNAAQFDPRVQSQPVVTNPYNSVSNPTGVSWPHYVSQKKAFQEGILSSYVHAALPNLELYINYNTTAAEQYRNTHVSSDWLDNDCSGFWWGIYTLGTNTTGTTRGVSSDLPSLQEYYANHSSWTNIGSASDGYQLDLLTSYLDGTGYDFGLGYTNDYAWLSGGWSNTDTNRLSDIPTYTGFLKCLYTAGMVGGVAGYFSTPTGTNGTLLGGPGFTASFPSNSPPHWLLQIMALAHVHALFSHLTQFTYQGTLLPGTTSNAMSGDQPAYEFTNTVADPYSRVLARKLNGQNQWIVTAWNSDGKANTVTVNIPIVGSLTVDAVPSGSVYQVIMSGTNVQQSLLDEYNSYLTNVIQGPTIQVNPASVPIGTILSGTSKTGSFTVQNVGGGTLSGSASVSAPFSIVSGGNYNLGSNQSQTVTVSFNPTSVGNYGQNVTLTGGGGATVTLSGSATNAPANPAIQVSPGSITIGTILSGTSKTGGFTVQNVGGGTLSGSATVGAPFNIISGGTYNLGSNASQTVTVSFNPTTAGSFSQNVTLTGGGGGTVGVSGSATNAPILPTVSAISMNVTDVDLNLAGLQIYSGTTVHFSATAANAQTWQWSYTVNGGSSVIYTNSTSPLTNISYFFSTNTVGNSYVWTLTVSNGLAWAASQTNLMVEAAPPPVTVITNLIQGPTIPATNGVLSSLLAASTVINGVSTPYWYQPLPSIGSTSGGTATYNVTITNAGNYEIQALVYAPNTSANSLLVNVDSQPQNPTMIWDITPLTSGFQQRTVSWRGNGSASSDQFVPMIFNNLSAGAHKIYFVGLDPGTALANFNLVQVVTTVQSQSSPPAPAGLRIVSSGP